MFERFTEQARQVVVLAQEEAHELAHNYIGTEHLLLGLLRAEGTLSGLVLATLGMRIEDARADVVRIAGPGADDVRRQIPFTPRSKKVLELALREALALGHNYIGAEHVLLGLVKESEGVAVVVLRDAGLSPDAIRDEVLRGLGNPQRAAGMPGYVVYADPSHPQHKSAESLDYQIESMRIRERTMSARLELLREDLANLRAERERLHGPAEEPEQP